MHEHARLATAGAGEHEEVLARVGNGVALFVVKRVEYMRDIHRRILRAVEEALLARRDFGGKLAQPNEE